MTVYFVTGKLGSGKSLISVGKIRDYMQDGRRVATNLNIFPDNLFTYSKSNVVRLPDNPRFEDMDALGKGYEHEDKYHNDESRYGLIVLDECGTWLNSREWNAKGRRDLIKWFYHARKRRWDVIFLIQDIESIDGQIFRSLGEHVVICRRMDKYKIPVIKLKMPRFHIASVYYGSVNKANFVDRWVYRGMDLYPLYDTLQEFDDGVQTYNGQDVDMRASYTFLSAWHLKGRYLDPPPEPRSLAKLAMTAAKWAFFGPALGYMAITRHRWLDDQVRRKWEQGERQIRENGHLLGLAPVVPIRDFA